MVDATPAPTLAPAIDTVVFDLGGVLIDWDPRYYYRDVFKGDEAAMENFLREVCPPSWNHKHDEGVSFADNAAARKQMFPAQADLIDAFWTGWPTMLKGPIDETVILLRALYAQGMPLYALTNWSHETFHVARERFDFLQVFRGIVVSGDEKLAKPDPKIFPVLTKRYNLDPTRCLFIDDVAANIAAADALGFTTIRFTGAPALAAELTRLKLLPARMDLAS